MPILVSPSDIRIGDIVVHNAGDIAFVVALDPEGFEVGWANAKKRNTRYPYDAIEDFSLCLPGGFVSRAILNPSSISQDVVRRPAEVALWLLQSTGRPMLPSELRAALTSRGVCGPEEAERWWNDLAQTWESEPSSPVRWDGQLLHTVEDPRASLEAAFATWGDDEKWSRWHSMGSDAQQRLLEKALERSDSATVATIVRLTRVWTTTSTTRTLHRILQGDAQLGAAALQWFGDRQLLTTLAESGAQRDRRPLLRRILEQVPPPVRNHHVCRMLAEVVANDEPATLFLTDLLRGGPADALPLLDRLGLSDEARMELEQWLEERLAESTMERPIQVADPLLTHLAPLPVERLFTVSLAAARALSRRHAEGSHGGVDGARWRAPDEVVLGAPENTTPRQDVRATMRRMVELAVGNLPRNLPVTDKDLLDHLPALVPEIPPAWVAVATLAMSPNPLDRPANGLDLWRHLAYARTTEELRQSAPIRMRHSANVGWDTHIGITKARQSQTNQDAAWSQTEGHLTFAVIADGISVATAGAGHIASGIVTQTCMQTWEENVERLGSPNASEVEARAFLDETLRLANAQICAEARRAARGDLDRHIPMGTTVILALVVGDRLHIASLGDSRAWLVGRDGAGQLTGDQNIRLDWLRSWQAHRPIDLTTNGSVLTGYLGHFDGLGQPDLLPVAHRSLSLLPGDTVVLATDGFVDYAADSPAGLARLLESAAALADLDEGARLLVQAANRGGGGDNITTLLIRHQLR